MVLQQATAMAVLVADLAKSASLDRVGAHGGLAEVADQPPRARSTEASDRRNGTYTMTGAIAGLILLPGIIGYLLTRNSTPHPMTSRDAGVTHIDAASPAIIVEAEEPPWTTH